MVSQMGKEPQSPQREINTKVDGKMAKDMAKGLLLDQMEENMKGAG